jgi:hypothetical protein
MLPSNELHCKALVNFHSSSGGSGNSNYNNEIFAGFYVWVLQLSGKLIVFLHKYHIVLTCATVYGHVKYVPSLNT